MWNGAWTMKVIAIPDPEALPAALNLSPEDCEHEAKMSLAVKDKPPALQVYRT